MRDVVNWKTRIEALEKDSFVDKVFSNLKYGEFGFWTDSKLTFRCFRYTALSEDVTNWVRETESVISS